uniref:Uncharacterized protein n=1 Tax=Meloidogyne hapla TaxID=6305 RepID=A0A1I8B069_MELHA
MKLYIQYVNENKEKFIEVIEAIKKLNPEFLELFKNEKRFDIFYKSLQSYEPNYDKPGFFTLDEHVIEYFIARDVSFASYCKASEASSKLPPKIKIQPVVGERCEYFNELGIYQKAIEKECESLKDIFAKLGVKTVKEENVQVEEERKIKQVLSDWMNEEEDEED